MGEATTVSTVNLTEFSDQFHPRYLGFIINGFASFIGIPGNLCVLLAIIFFREMRTISNMYIFNLAVADLLFLLGTPVVIAHGLLGTWIFGGVMCKMFLCGNAISQFASAAFIGVLSFDRYLAVCRPVQATEWRTCRAALIISFVAWVLVVIEMIPMFMAATLVENDDLVSCELSMFNPADKLENITHEDVEFTMRFFTTYTFTLSYLLPLIAVWIFYANIIARMWARRKHLFHKKKTVKRTTTKVSLLGLAIVISYTICWLPFWALQFSIVEDLDWIKSGPSMAYAQTAAYTLQYINSAANPFLYVFLSDAFRRNVMQLLRARGTYAYRKPARSRDGGETMLFLNSNTARTVTETDR